LTNGVNRIAGLIRGISSRMPAGDVSVVERIHSCLSQPRPGKRHLRNRHCRWWTPFLPWLLSLIVVVQTCALPIPLAFLLISADAKPMTKGCETKTCCTALCYLDGHGVHHCVHMHTESCERGLSTHDQDVNPILYWTVGTLPKNEALFPVFCPAGWISQVPAFAETHIPPTPSPPPQ
jgi:hypothetical protein